MKILLLEKIFSKIKFSNTGYRDSEDGQVYGQGGYGYYLTTSVSGEPSVSVEQYMWALGIDKDVANVSPGLGRGNGMSVRCIKDMPISIGIDDTNLLLGHTATINVIFAKEVDLTTIDLSNFTTPNGTISNYNEANNNHISFTLTPNSDTNDDTNVIALDTAWSYGDATTPSESTTSQTYSVNTVIFSGGDFNGVTYGLITSSETGKVWLDRNLGASQACTSLSDSACYGDYYQWGRNADGHQISTSDTNSTQITWDTANNDTFITSSVYPYKWALDDSDGLLREARWSAIDGSGICPIGFRVPSSSELQDENITDGTSAFNNLKLSYNGYRDSGNGVINNTGNSGNLLSSTPNGTDEKAWFLTFDNSSSGVYNDVYRASGNGVRCIKD